MRRVIPVEPPAMRSARAEMRDMECHGQPVRPSCGTPVTLACPRCGCHRCEECTAIDRRCPMCVVTDMYFPEHWIAEPVPVCIPGGAPCAAS